MQKEIIINSSSTQNRVAITEDGNLVDFFIDHQEKKRMVGNIYLGRVARVLPGIRAAFINIGLKHDAFLHFSDIGETLKDLQNLLDDDEADDIDEDAIADDEDDNDSDSNTQAQKKEIRNNAIPKLHKGQDILVQIIKEPVKDKGVRVTSSISIPGRFCVLLPFDNKIGISKKIVDFKERRRLRKLARGILPKNCGLIIRTAAKNQSEESLLADLKYLINTWDSIQENVKEKDPPSVVYNDLGTTISVIRDLFTPDISRVFVDSKKLYKEIESYVKIIQPALLEKIEYYKYNDSIFDAFKIEEQIKSLMGRRVHMPSGGHIVIEHTEAMTVIDVNSGRYAAKKQQELNSLKTDLEAARELVRQLRLRDIGGLIVVDFIDLEDDKNRKKVYDELKKEFRKDRAKIAMLPMTDFGIMQITRQRIRQNIVQSMHEDCPYCNGSGLLTKRSNIVHEIEEWLKRFKLTGKGRSLILKVHPSLKGNLKNGKISTLTKLELKYFIRMKLEFDERISPQTFQFYSAKSGEDITADFT
ncbi:MAG: Rne/Rng family ribonuclease [Ignavibacteriae bacterium]|nr:Rne/Rng family ribonuclease [Ignavibacteriota bacterium]NOG96913.1 Rne/Rng family ribonuclease [Ignavibacteriota bacterium]